MGDFIESRISEAVKEGLGAGFRVEMNDVRKNNGTVRKGCFISEQGAAVAQIVYIDFFLLGIRSGRICIGEAAQEIIRAYRSGACEQEARSLEGKLDRQGILGIVMHKLINSERNREILSGIPHRPFLDLEAVYFAVVSVEEDGFTGFTVTDKICTALGIGAEELEAAARRNMEAEGFDVLPLHSLIGDSPLCTFARDLPLWVFRSRNGANGAAAMLYESYFHGLAEAVSDDLYILPSSIHDVIALPCGGYDPGSLRAMVESVNSTEVTAEEFLSGSVYRYSRDGGFSIA